VSKNQKRLGRYRLFVGIEPFSGLKVWNLCDVGIFGNCVLSLKLGSLGIVFWAEVGIFEDCVKSAAIFFNGLLIFHVNFSGGTVKLTRKTKPKQASYKVRSHIIFFYFLLERFLKYCLGFFRGECTFVLLKNCLLVPIMLQY